MFFSVPASHPFSAAVNRDLNLRQYFSCLSLGPPAIACVLVLGSKAFSTDRKMLEHSRYGNGSVAVPMNGQR